MRKIALKTSGAILGVFGMLTLFISVSVLLSLFGIREKMGENLVFFILYTNLFCSFIYLYSSYCFFTENKRATKLLFIAVGVLIIAYLGLIVYIQMGYPYEVKTVAAMLGRTCLTILFAGISWYFLTRTKLVNPNL